MNGAALAHDCHALFRSDSDIAELSRYHCHGNYCSKDTPLPDRSVRKYVPNMPFFILKQNLSADAQRQTPTPNAKVQAFRRKQSTSSEKAVSVRIKKRRFSR